MKIPPFPSDSSDHARRLAALLLAAGVMGSSHSQAANATWTGATDGNWQTNSNWTGIFPGTSGTNDIATFNSGGNGNTSLTAGTLSLGAINFDAYNVAAYNIGAGTLTFSNTGAINVGSAVRNNQTISANILANGSGFATSTSYPTGFSLRNTSQTSTLTVSGNITGPAGTGSALVNLLGTGTIAITGAISDGTTKLAVNSLRYGTTVLSGANTFSGTANNNGLAAYDYSLSVGMGGKLVLDYSTGNVVVPSNTVIALGTGGNSGGTGTTLNGNNTGGTLVFKTGSSAISVGNLLVGNSYNNIVVDAAGGNGSVVTIGNNWANWGASSRATINFDLSAAGPSGGIKLSGAPSTLPLKFGNVLTSGGKAITMQDSSGKTYFANTDASNNIVAQTTYTALPTTGGSSTTNYQVTANTTATGNLTGNVLRMEGASANQTLDLGGFALSLTSAAFILDGANNFTISNGTFTTTQNGLNIGAFGTGRLTVAASLTAANKEIYRSGNGLVEFTGNNSTANGGFRAQAGVTRFSSANAVTGGLLSLSNGGIVEVGYDFTRALGTGAGQVAFNSGAPGGFSAYGGNRFVNIGGAGATLTFGSANFVASRDSQLILSSQYSDGTIDFQNGLNLANETQTILVNNGTAAVDAKLSGKLTAGSLVKTGEGVLALTNDTNDYSGGTVVNAGTLLVNNTTGSGAGSAGVVVNGGAVGGTGAFSGALVVNAGGTLAPGASIETLGTGDVTLNGLSTFAYEVDSSAAASAGADLLKVSGGLSLNGPITLSLTDIAGSPVAITAGTTFSLVNYTGAWNGGLLMVGGNTIADGGTFVVGLNTWQIDYNATTGGSNFSGEYTPGSFVNITVVPEPSVTVLAALGLTTVTLVRRRRS